MGGWLKDNALYLTAMTLGFIVVMTFLVLSYEFKAVQTEANKAIAATQAETSQKKAEEGLKFKFGFTKDKE